MMRLSKGTEFVLCSPFPRTGVEEDGKGGVLHAAAHREVYPGRQVALGVPGEHAPGNNRVNQLSSITCYFAAIQSFVGHAVLLLQP